MTAIWSNDGEGWALLSPTGFPDEASLHSLIEQSPQLLPLAGSPRLTILGREVRLGNGSADLIAVEPNGRLVVIEVKLANNAEARRAVVAQVFSPQAASCGRPLRSRPRPPKPGQRRARIAQLPGCTTSPPHHSPAR